MLLDTNYRSTPNIVEGASRIIANNKARFPKEINTVREKGKDIEFAEFVSPQDVYKRQVLLLLYSLCSYFGLRRRLGTAIPDGEGCYTSDRIRTPFVLGMFRAKIYLPVNLSAEEREHVLLHERMHIRRGDTVFKPVFYLALVIHWFNPLVWFAYRLMAKDIEMACDEAVMSKLGENKRRDYCRSLLNLALRGQPRTAHPLAFGCLLYTSRCV